jgi:hypothetical protein
MARRLREMQENAKWKEQVKKDNVVYAKKELEKETVNEEAGKRNATFIK